jgi:para-aminobenzoate synthetase/4-amino-4-deoxychorismate lyase
LRPQLSARMNGTVVASGDIFIQKNRQQWLYFQRPCDVLVAATPDDIPSVLASLDAEVSTGMAVAGFMSYEAAGGIDPVLKTHAADSFPVAWFGVYDDACCLDELPSPDRAVGELNWSLSVTPDRYADAIQRIKAYIEAGDTYQVNFTMRMRSPFSGDAYALFHRLQRSQQASYGAYIDLGDRAVCSASPELFFEVDGRRIVSRPMKGTSHRAPAFADDQRLVEELQASPKNRAENVMIVDMVRNDLGRVADAGSVVVESLYDVERYPTVSQMTSTVAAESDASLGQILGALFPCASITGAPKVRTMEIIKKLEEGPRGIYTGTIGYWLPERKARFNVAIRTVSIDRAKREATYGVGGGVVWDSVDTHEFAECATKAEVLNAEPRAFRLLETLLWTPPDGFFLLDRHVARAMQSGTYFGIPVDANRMRRELRDAVEGVPQAPHRVRWTLGRNGDSIVEASSIGPDIPVSTVTIAPGSCSSIDPFLYHKTTQREVYTAARRSHPECDDVLLVNERGEITEATIANVVIEIGGERITPPVSCGLLAGTFRDDLVARGEIREGILTPEMVRAADAVWLINSVRRWMPVTVAE